MRILFPEFLDELATTRYPFADGTTLKAQNTGQEIDVESFLDASLYPIGARQRVYVSSIEVEARKVTITLGDSLRTELASGEFDPVEPPSVIPFFDIYDRPAGVLVSEPLRLSQFGTWELGTHTFLRGATEFVASCVIPTPADGVQGFLLPNGQFVTGDVWLVGENGVVVREQDGAIRIDMVGDPLFARKLCKPIQLFQTPRFVRTINGCPPVNGNYNLTVGEHLNEHTVIRLSATDDGLKIEAIGRQIQG